MLATFTDFRILNGMNSFSFEDDEVLTWTDGIDRLCYHWRQGLQIRPLLDAEFKDGDGSSCQVLLIPEIAITGDQEIELGFSDFDEVAIGEGGPAALGGECDLMANQMAAEWCRCAVVEDNPHAEASSGIPRSADRCAANSSTARQCSIVTGGYQSTNSSKVTPRPRFSNKYEIGSLVWSKHQRPPILSGSRHTAGHSLQSNSIIL